MKHWADRMTVFGSPGSLTIGCAIFLACASPLVGEIPRAEGGAVSQDEKRVRARELGITIGQYQPGPLNAITDVDGVNPFYGPSAGGFPQYQAISKVVVDPNNSNNVVVGTKTGVFFSLRRRHQLDRPVLHEHVHRPPTQPAPGHHRRARGRQRRDDDALRRRRHARPADAGAA